MKIHQYLPVLLALFASAAVLGGETAVATSGKGAVTTAPLDDRYSHLRPDGHAPIGVMTDHAHHAGEWMMGYRYMWQHTDGLQQGRDNLSVGALFDTVAPNGDHYTVAPLEMDMHMHMLELMYAPTDWLTLMVMTGYMEMSMDMYGSGHHGGHGGGHGGEEHGPVHRQHFTHESSGWSDTSLTALFTLFDAHRQTVHLDLGLSFPTGSVDEKVSGDTFTHYGMQLGSGTYDLLPGITYLGQCDRVSWGAQYSAILRLEEENDSGFRFGNVHQVTAWTAYRLCDWASVSGRIAYRHEGQIRHHYDGPHNHSSPPDFQQNYGGDTIDLGVGLNLWASEGTLRRNRIAIEALWPVFQDLNGIQLEKDFTLVVGWQWAF
jgi:hypothetical protein